MVEGLTEKNRNDSKTLNLIGLFYLRTKKYSEARGIFSRIIQLTPKDAWAYYLLASTYESQNQLEEALVFNDKASNVDPKSLYYLRSCYILCLKQANYPDSVMFEYQIERKFVQKALYYAEKMLNLEPKNPDHFSSVAHSHKILGNFPKALEYYEKAKQLETDPHTIDFYNKEIRNLRSMIHR